MKEKSLLFKTAHWEGAEARAELFPREQPLVPPHPAQAGGQELSWMKTAATSHLWALHCCLRLGADISTDILEAGKEILSQNSCGCKELAKLAEHGGHTVTKGWACSSGDFLVHTALLAGSWPCPTERLHKEKLVVKGGSRLVEAFLGWFPVHWESPVDPGAPPALRLLSGAEV